MIKVLGIENSGYEKTTLPEIVEYFKDKEWVQYDSETTGLILHSSNLLCFQLGDFDNQFVISADKVGGFKDFLEEKPLIGHNIKFDLGFLYKEGIFPNKVYDTFLAESVITCGFKTTKRNLAAVAKRRLDIDLDKSIREDIGKEGLTDKVIEYSANDVKYLEQIKESQDFDIKRLQLKHDLEVQNQFVLVLAYIEFCGFKLDKDKWSKKMAEDAINFITAEQDLNDYMVANHPEYIDIQGDLFNDVLTTTINWSSSRQVVKLFKELKIPVSVVIKGVEKETVEAKNIEKWADKYEIVRFYLKYKEYEKVVSTYGESFIKQISPKTGRIHTHFKQIMDTGRLSSGGTDKGTKVKFINFQNIPSDKTTRNCFVAEKGNSLVVADYSGQEQVVLANRSLDPALLEFYDKGLADMHSFVASKMYPELEGMSLDDIKKHHKDKRQSAKTAGFAINYGGVGATIARNNNLTIEEGEAVYEAYFKAFPGLHQYFDHEKEKGLTLGYIEFNDIIKTKSFIEGYDTYLKLKQEINRGFWDRWKVLKAAALEGKVIAEYTEMKEKISLFFKIKGAIERKSLNFPIQGTSATITKISGIYFFRWIKENNYLNKILFVNTVHDENVIECPDELAEETANALNEAMVKAGAIFCKRVPLKVDVKILKKWEK